jgi:hypothetical protein
MIAAYWLVFAGVSIRSAQSPGYVRHPELVAYPWRGLVLMLALLALLVATFYLVLLPPRFRTSYWRLPLALALGAALLTGSILTFATDLPGLYYVPLLFSFLTMLVLLVISASTVIGALWRKWKAAP